MAQAVYVAESHDRRILLGEGDGVPRARGKFLFRGEEKFLVRGVSYGPFAVASHGGPFPELELARRDLVLMRQLGANCLRTFTPPPEWFLDLAGEHGLVVLSGLPWTQHVCFLDDAGVTRQVRQAVLDGARRCAAHPATLAVLIGNEIPPDIVRWLGPERVSAFLQELYGEVKSVNADTLVSYANFPSTEYLDVDFLDFISFNVYLHREPDFRHYLSRLQNLARDKPLVLTEFGIDSIREGQAAQAEILRWQVRAAFESGVAGTVVFSWTDDWYTGGFQVEDWAFGLVGRERQEKPSFHAVQSLYRSPLPPPIADPPRVSIVICAYNAARTLDACLASMRELSYPSYEVIVVNDGSTDRTLEIAERYPEVRIISQENRGLSAARNVGAAAATSEIIAYTDSDCVADPDWLTYLVYKFNSGYVAVGGPNLPPPEDARMAACVAAAPGGPTHVLLNDEVAEHIPGCNMAFRRSALEEIEGFDPLYRAAGDDVDLCWRLQNIGYAIGFSPAAMVWHFRRNTTRAYLRQQMGYGKAEALLYFKHPYRFNLLGQSQWLGRIYGDLTMSLFSRRPVIYHGVFGRGLFQTLYEAPSSLVSYLPFTLEWNLFGVVVFIAALIAGRYRALAALPLLVSWASAIGSAWRARLEARFDGVGSRLLIASLIYLGPLVRSVQRYLWRLQGIADVERIHFAEAPPRSGWRRQFVSSYWSARGLEKENLLHAVMQFLIPRKYLLAIDPGWNDWDLIVYRGVWAQATLKVAVENHGGVKRLFRVLCRVRMSRFSKLAIAAFALVAALTSAAGLWEIGVVSGVVGLITIAAATSQNVRLGRTMYGVLEVCAKMLELTGVESAPT